MVGYELREELQMLIKEETLYLRHYRGEVIDNKDSEKKGRVFVIIPELGFDSVDKAIPCYARDKNSMSLPAVGDYVEVYFMNGNPNEAVYLGNISEYDGNIPESFTGDPEDHVLFESPKIKADNLKYNKSKELVIFEGSDFAVKFNELKTAFDQLKSDHNSFLLHVHGGVTPGPPTSVSGPPAPPAIPSTADMSSAKVDKVRL